jgi:hypothetical protein
MNRKCECISWCILVNGTSPKFRFLWFVRNRGWSDLHARQRGLHLRLCALVTVKRAKSATLPQEFASHNVLPFRLLMETSLAPRQGSVLTHRMPFLPVSLVSPLLHFVLQIISHSVSGLCACERSPSLRLTATTQRPRFRGSFPSGNAPEMPKILGKPFPVRESLPNPLVEYALFRFLPGSAARECFLAIESGEITN